MQPILQTFIPQLLILFIIYVLVLFVIFLDFFSGIRKAKRRSEFRSSYGFRKTVDKICRYFNMILVITAIDAVQMIAIVQLNAQTDYTLPVLPILTFMGAMFVGFIELKSIYENSEKKEQARIDDAGKALVEILGGKNVHEMIEGLVNYAKSEKQKGKEADEKF